MRIPFFHYTSLDNMPSIFISSRLISRSELNRNITKFNDISIDSAQQRRDELGLLRYIPLFAGFYTIYNEDMNDYLKKKSYCPLVQNKSFYGALNKTLQTKMGCDYEKIIILLVNDELLYRFADEGKIRFFTDTAIKRDSTEKTIMNRRDLRDCLATGIDVSNISGEIDLFDDGKTTIGCLSDIEAIIVDNAKIKTQVEDMLAKHNAKEGLSILVEELPRNPTANWITRPNEDQAAFAAYVENLKRNRVTGEKYREEVAKWRKEHKALEQISGDDDE